MDLFSKGTPVILKEESSAQAELAELERLRGNVPANMEARLESDIRALKAGIAGEERVLYELRNSHMDMFVLQDLCLEHNGLGAQIDFLVLTRRRNFVIECKNLYGNIRINERGDFIRTGGGWHEGAYSPVTQNKRHLELIREMRVASRGVLTNLLVSQDFDDVYRSLVVLANPKTILNDRYAPKDVKKQTIRADRLISTIESINAEHGPGRDTSPLFAVEKTARWFLEQHKQRDVGSFSAKYRNADGASEGTTYGTSAKSQRTPSNMAQPASGRLNQSAEMSTLAAGILTDMGSAFRGADFPQHGAASGDHSGATVYDRTSTTPACPRCGAPMVLRTATRGQRAGKQFYGCSRYPQCRGIINIG